MKDILFDLESLGKIWDKKVNWPDYEGKLKSGGKKVFHLGERCKTYKKVGALGNIDMRLDIRDARPPKETGKCGIFSHVGDPP